MEANRELQDVQPLAMAHEATADVPIIMVSGVTTETGFRVDQDGEKPDWLRVVQFVNKPVDPVVLAQKAVEIVGA